ERQGSDRGVEHARVLRFPESPVRATTGNAPEAPDPTLGGELPRTDPLGRGQAFEFLWIAVRGPLHLDVHEEFHRCGRPSPRSAAGSILWLDSVSLQPERSRCARDRSKGAEP